MKAITAAQAAAFAGGRLIGDADVLITGVSTDSRNIPEGSLFLALRGERFDGHKFIEKAVQNGACAVISEEEIDLPVPVIVTKSTAQALLNLAGGYRSMFDIPVVGITGSVGKTTTKEMTASVLSEKYRTLYTQGNFNNEIGMPLTVFRTNENTQALVLEMGMSAFGEISRMTAQAKPDIAVITNIGTAHIEYLGSREGICRAKLEILEGLREGGTAVLCGDEPLLWDKRDELGVKTVWFGIDNPECDVRAEHIILSDGCVKFDMIIADRTVPVTLNTSGRHNVYNALAAASVGIVMGLSDDEITQGLAKFADLHQNIYKKNGFTIIDACYNASPDSIEASLDVLRDMNIKGRRFAVLGGMRELGDYHKQSHIRCGKYVFGRADYLFALGDGAEYYREGALEAGMNEQDIKIFDSREQMIEALRPAAHADDALLFKASRYWQIEKVLDGFLSDSEK